LTKLGERLALIANLSVVVGIVFLAVELRQNTRIGQAQIRDAMTDKQMTFAGWLGQNRDAADVFRRGEEGMDQLDATERVMYTFIVAGLIREWENSHYQNEHGLFTTEEFEARRARWRRSMERPGYRDYWAANREAFAPRFRADIDNIVEEIESGL